LNGGDSHISGIMSEVMHRGSKMIAVLQRVMVSGEIKKQQ